MTPFFVRLFIGEARKSTGPVRCQKYRTGPVHFSVIVCRSREPISRRMRLPLRQFLETPLAAFRKALRMPPV